MQLKDISETSCVHCGARIVSESVRSIHTNGHGFESRQFECGRSVEFVPNFMRVEVKAECSKSQSETDKRQKRASATAKLNTFIDKLDVDDAWKTEAKSTLDGWRFR